MASDFSASGWAKIFGGDRKQFDLFFEKMLDGFAYHKTVVDRAGKPVDYVFLEVNHAFERMTGLKRERIIGKRATEVLPGFEKDPADLIGVYGRVALTGKPVQFETWIESLNKWLRVSAYCSEKGYFVTLVEDITEHKKAEEALRKLNRHLKAVSNSNQALMHATDEAKFTQEVCNIIINDCGYVLVWVGFAEHDEGKTVRPVAFAGFDKGYIDALKVTWDGSSERGRGPTGTVIRTGKPYICKNMQIDPNFKPWRREALKKGYTASLVLPLISFEGETFGAINIYSKESEPFTEEEVKLLTELSNDFSYGIGILRLRKKREQAEETLRKQASLIDLSPDAIIVRQLDGVITFWSKGAEKMYGWTKEEAIGQVTHTLLKTEFPISHKEILSKLKLDGKWSGELIHTCKDGSKVVVQSFLLGQYGADGKIESILESNIDITERKQQEREVKSLAKFPSENPNSIFRIDGKGTILYCNQAGASFLAAWKSKVGERAPAHISQVVAGALASDKRFEVEETFGAKIFSLLFVPVILEGYVNIYGNDITERKKAEEALKESEHLYRTVFDNSQDGFQLIELIYDENGKPYDHKFLRVNRAYEKIIGVKAKDVTGKTARNIFPNCEFYWFEVPDRVVKTGRSEHVELYNKDINKTLDCYYFPYSKNAVGTLFRDVTERKKTEEKLRVASLYSRSLLEASLDPLVTISSDGKITDVNKATESVTGFSRGQLIGSDFSDYFTDPEKARKGYQEVFAQGFVRDYPLAIRHKTGKITDVLYNATLFRNETGDIQGVFAAARDVTERKQAEETLRKQAALIDLSPDGIIVKRLDDTITFWSQGAEKLYGWTKEEVIGQQTRVLFKTTFPDSLDNIIKQLKETGKWSGELIHHAKDGNEVIVQSSWLATFDKNGELIEILESNVDMTERKHSEEKLNAASLYSRSLIEASLDPLVTISADGKITDVNKSTEDVTGVPRDQLIGSDFSDYFTEPRKARAGYQKVFTDGFVRDYPLVIRHKSGKTTDVLYNATVFRNETGEIQGVFAAARDVTERKRAEERVRAASLYSRSLIEASLDPLVTISADGKITDVNKSTEDVTGVPRDQLIGSDFSDYFTEPEEARKGYRKVFTDGYVVDYPLAIRHRSGKVTDVLYNASIYRNEAGEVQGVFAAARDVTERKRAEEQLRAASLYTRSLIEASLDPLVTISAKGKITDVNKATEDVTGCSREELIGSDFSDYFTAPDEARAGYRKVFTEGFVKDYPLAIRHKSGRITDVLYNASLYRNPQGEIQGVFAAARDITVRKAMENEIKQTMEKLQQSNAELEQFAYVASHDLQEPLRMVASYVQLLERRYKGKLDPEADEFIAYAVDGANRMRGLIDDLLTYSRVSRLGKPFEPTDLESTLDVVLMNLQASITENGAVVTHDKLPVVVADGGQLVQLFQNLIGNAIKFHGKEPPRVHVSVQVKETEYLFSVRDNGIGIAPEYFDRLFKIFQRLHTREEYPGSGIGLAVCKKIVERHGGRIWIESQVGKGSTIYFTLNKQKRSD